MLLAPLVVSFYRRPSVNSQPRNSHDSGDRQLGVSVNSGRLRRLDARFGAFYDRRVGPLLVGRALVRVEEAGQRRGVLRVILIYALLLDVALVPVGAGLLLSGHRRRGQTILIVVGVSLLLLAITAVVLRRQRRL